MEEVEAHCERCDDNTDETSEVQIGEDPRTPTQGRQSCRLGERGRSKSLSTGSFVPAGK